MSDDFRDLTKKVDVISRQAAIDALVKAIREDPYYDSNEAINGLGVCDVRVILNDLPSAQPERKTGKWIYHPDWEDDGECPYECSECGMGSDYTTNYCPRCGADMRGEQDDESRSNSNAQTDTRARGMGATDKSSGI